MSCMLEFSLSMSGCCAAFFAVMSANSFPGIPTCPGTQSSLNLGKVFCSMLLASVV